MLSEKTLATIVKHAKAYDVQAVWLFGSAMENEETANDIDLAVEGLESYRFFDFFGKIFWELEKLVDLVDLSEDPPLSSIIRSTGVKIYER